MNSINAKVNVKRVAIYLTLNLLLFSFCLRMLLAITLARSYSFNSSSSVSVWLDGLLSISTRSLTLGSLGEDFLTYTRAGVLGRLVGRRGHSEI